jgi:hypothetical protein
MDNKNAKLLFLLTIVIIAVAAIFYHSTTHTTFRPADADFSVDESFLVTRIFMTSNATGESINLYLDHDNFWKLNDNLIANDPAVDELLTIMERMRVWQPVSIAASADVEEILQARGVRVEVYVQSYRVRFGNVRLFPHETLHQSFVVGDDAPDGESTYMRKTASQRAFRVVMPGYASGISSIFEPSEKAWRDPVIIDSTKEMISSIQVLVPDNLQESYILKNINDNEFAFFHADDPGHQMDIIVDDARLQRFLTSFTGIYYETLLDDEAENFRKEIMFGQPFVIISVEMKDGNTIRMEMYGRKPVDVEYAGAAEQDPNRFYIRVNEGEFAVAQYYVFNRILRPLSFFKK